MPTAARSFALPLVLTVAVLVGPILADVLHGGERRLFGYAAADTFYYLVVGRNVGLEGLIASDGEHPSNGFHPLWQAVVSLVYALRLPGHGTHFDLAWLLTFELLLLVASVWFVARAFRRPDGSLTSFLPLLVPGVFGLLVAPVWLSVPVATIAAQNSEEGPLPLYGTWWSFANGMESSLSVGAFCLLLWLWVDRPLEDRRAATRFGLSLAVLMLSRLDLVFVAGAVWALAVLRLPTVRARLALTFAAASPVAAYLLFSKWYFGAAMPVSGSLKSTVPYVNAANFTTVWDVYNTLLSGGVQSIPAFFRVSQLVVPALAVVLTPALLLSFKRNDEGVVVTWGGPALRASFFAASGVGVALLLGYDFFFVPLFSQGHWYVPVPELFVSLLALHALERLAERVPERFASSLKWGALVGVPALGLAFFLRLHHQPDYHARYASFWFDEAPAIRAHLPPDARLLEYDDGIVSWATQRHAMSGTGLGLDVEGAEASKAGLLAQLAVKRGYDHVTSLVYWGFGGVDSEEGLQRWVDEHFKGLGLRGRVAYRSKVHDWSIVQLLPPR